MPLPDSAEASCFSICAAVADGCSIPLEGKCDDFCAQKPDESQLTCLRGQVCEDVRSLLRRESFACGLEPDEKEKPVCVEFGDSCESSADCCSGACRSQAFSGVAGADICQPGW